MEDLRAGDGDGAAPVGAGGCEWWMRCYVDELRVL